MGRFRWPVIVAVCVVLVTVPGVMVYRSATRGIARPVEAAAATTPTTAPETAPDTARDTAPEAGAEARPMVAAAGAGLRATINTGGMEGLSEISVQAHVAGGEDWREIVGLSQDRLEGELREFVAGVPGLPGLPGVPGLQLVEASPNVPRLSVQLVGHVIACDDGSGSSCASHLLVSLSQPVKLVRPGAEGEEVVVGGATWQRTMLMTGEAATMGGRVREKVRYLLEQFRGDYLRANPQEGEGAE